MPQPQTPEEVFDTGSKVAVQVDWRNEEAVENLMEVMKTVYSADLLSAKYAADDPGYVERNPTAGHCSVGAEALWHMIGGKASPYRDNWAYDRAAARERQAQGLPRAGEDETHHWLAKLGDPSKRFDPTADQYLNQVQENGRIISEPPPYQWGMAAGFMTKMPSARAQCVIDRVANALLKHPIDGIEVDEGMIRDPEANPAKPFRKGSATYAKQPAFYAGALGLDDGSGGTGAKAGATECPRRRAGHHARL